MNRIRRTPLIALAMATFLAAAATPAVAQEQTTAENEAAADRVGQGSFVWAPIPVLQPALGGGAVLVGMYFYPHAEGRPANITGEAAGITIFSKISASEAR